MASPRTLTAEEQLELEQLEAAIAQEEARLKGDQPKSETDLARERILTAAKNAGIQIVSEAGGAALGQKAGLPLAPYTFGMSVPILGAAGGLAGYETAMRSTGQEPTMLGRLQAAGMGAIPFAPEARLAAAGASTVSRVTAPEVVQSGLRMGAATGAATVAPKLATGEEVTAMDVLPAAGGALTGAAARYAGARTATGTIQGRQGPGPVAAAGPSEEAAAAAISKAQNLSRDAQLRNWQAAGGVLDSRYFNPNVVTRTMEKAVGESNIALEELQRINIAKVGEIGRREIGLPATAELTLDTFKQRRDELYQAYENLRNLSPAASTALDELQDARDVMRKSWRAWRSAKDANKGSTPDLLEAAEQATQDVDKLEKRLDRIAQRAGSAQAYRNLQEARPQLAKLWVIDSALDRGPNTIDPSVIGQLHNSSPNLLTDGLRMIAEVYNTQPQAFGTKAVREMARERRLPIPSSLRLGSTTAASGGLGYLGYQYGGTPGAIAGGIAGMLAGQVGTDVASDVLRRQMLPFISGTGGPFAQRFQQAYGMPQYGTNVPSNLSLFLAKSGGPGGMELQQYLQQQQQQSQPPRR